MNAYEIEQVEARLKAETRLPLSFDTWVEIERRAREERAHVVGSAIARFFAALSARIAGLGRQVRETASDCTDARLRHS